MKRKNNLYAKLYNIENITKAFDEVCRNTKNKRKVNNYKEYKCIHVSRIYNNTNNFIYLGKDRKGKHAKYRQVNRKIKKKCIYIKIKK